MNLDDVVHSTLNVIASIVSSKCMSCMPQACMTASFARKLSCQAADGNFAYRTEAAGHGPITYTIVLASHVSGDECKVFVVRC